MKNRGVSMKNFSLYKRFDKTYQAKGKFTVLNSKGIHHRPVIFFCLLAQKYPNNTITLFHRGKSWEYKGPQSRIELLQKEIHQGEEIEVHICGERAEQLLAHIVRAAESKFCVVEKPHHQ